MTDTMPFKLDRTVVIAATPETVYRYFTDSARWAAWWGAGSTVEPKPGGKVYMRHPDGTESGGEVIEMKAATRFVFTYGFAKGKPFPMGGSRVTITLEAEKAGTRLLSATGPCPRRAGTTDDGGSRPLREAASTGTVRLR